jgi:catechol 2,3-dioxygenase-like lactoylglutathione lyase family enzyme
MKILSLELSTMNLSKMKHFYLEQLSFPLKGESDDSFTITAGHTELTFTYDRDQKNPFYHFAMDIPNNQIQEVHDWLLKKGCHILDATTIEEANIYADEKIVFFGETNAQSVYFFDPQGNLVEFIARKNLDNSSVKPFDPLSIINISEIGFSLQNDVEQTIDKLCTEFDVTPYTGDGKTFQILGNDQGMFILGAGTRTWYPISRSPEIHPIHMTIAGNKNDRFQLEPYPYFIQTKKIHERMDKSMIKDSKHQSI